MNIDEPSRKSLELIVEDLKKQLKMVNESVIKAEDFRLEDYDEVRAIYELVKKRPQLTMMQIEGVLAELGELRKRS